MKEVTLKDGTVIAVDDQTLTPLYMYVTVPADKLSSFIEKITADNLSVAYMDGNRYEMTYVNTLIDPVPGTSNFSVKVASSEVDERTKMENRISDLEDAIAILTESSEA